MIRRILQSHWGVTAVSVIGFVLAASWFGGMAAINLEANRQTVRFISEAEAELEAIARRSKQSAFLVETMWSSEHERQARDLAALEQTTKAAFAGQATEYGAAGLNKAQTRKLELLKAMSAVPGEDEMNAELSDLTASLQAHYRNAEICRGLDQCRQRSELYRTMRTSRTPQDLLSAWQEWHAHGAKVRDEFTRLVALSNAAARKRGYSDAGEQRRSAFYTPSQQLTAQLEHLWADIKPLYQELQCHTQHKLREFYGDDIVTGNHIPAHLTGHMWAQSWTGIQDIVAPQPITRTMSVTNLLQANGSTSKDMVKMGEYFFRSLGFSSLPEKFWTNSVFEAPTDRPITCQASAWPVNIAKGDVRIKMCAEPTEADFQTVHHELGHVYYYLAYANQPFLFRRGANPAFHETIGDTISLSVTPAYLHQVGVLAKPAPPGDVSHLTRKMLDVLPKLAMGMAAEQWRWSVYAGDVDPTHYNRGWWSLRKTVQGISPPAPYTEDTFDAGMFLHILYDVPYDKYILALIQQFDFHRALCETAGYEGPLHQCSIDGNNAAGEKLQQAMALGASEPWPDVYEIITGRREPDAAALLEYFDPIADWLASENKDRLCGW